MGVVFTREGTEGGCNFAVGRAAVAGTGIRASVPIRDIVTYSEDEDSLLVLLLVYSGGFPALKRKRTGSC
jgi:hypothetical protein